MKAYIAMALLAVLGGAMAAPSVSVGYSVTPESVNPGGTAQVIVTVTNTDMMEIRDLRITLSSRTVGVSAVSGTTTLGNLPVGATTSASFAVKVGQTVAPGTYVVEATGTQSSVTGDDSLFKLNIPIVVGYRSNLEIFVPDVQITPGASENLLVTLNNAGKSVLRDVIVNLAPGSSYVYPIGNMRASITMLSPSGSSEASFQVRASDTAMPGIQPMTMTVTYTDAGGATQTETQFISITIVDAGTEVVVDSINSSLESGKTGKVKIGVKNVGEVDLTNLYFSITTGVELRISGSNEKMMDSLAVGEVGYVEFVFDVSQDSEAKPVESTLSVTYQREGGKKQITDTKPLGITVNGKVDIRIVDIKPDQDNMQIEVDIANYGNKDADAVRIEALSRGVVFGTGFTDKIKPNKHKVFRFDMPTDANVLLRITYKDYTNGNGTTTVEESMTLDKTKLAKAADGSGGMMMLLVVLIAAALIYWKRKGKKIEIDVSKYRQEKKA
jgi:hypothetical protein